MSSLLRAGHLTRSTAQTDKAALYGRTTVSIPPGSDFPPGRRAVKGSVVAFELSDRVTSPSLKPKSGSCKPRGADGARSSGGSSHLGSERGERGKRPPTVADRVLLG